MLHSVGTPVLWCGFTLLVLILLVVDLLIFHRTPRAMKPREAIFWVIFWLGLGLLFNVGVYVHFGRERALEFLTGYIVEEALSVDNLFVFIVIFAYFKVPAIYQHRVLFWGILGAMIMRAIFIIAGAALINTFHWMIYIFGGFLIFTGFKILRQKESDVQPERNPILRIFRRFVPTSTEFHGARFVLREGGRLVATPLLVVLVVIEATDVVFAIDSIPAVFGVTRDPFIAYTSNILAVLGLSAWYFLLASAMEEFDELKIGLGFVLIFVGAKMAASPFISIPITASLAVVAGLLISSVGISLIRKQRAKKRTAI